MRSLIICMLLSLQFIGLENIEANDLQNSEMHAIQLPSLPDQMINPECGLVNTKANPLLLVVGCGRSGTKYMYKFLNASGLDVGHERTMGKHGCVSWLMSAIIDWAPWGPLSKDYQFKHIFHQVRNPVNVIQSFYNVPPLATWEWISEVIPEVKLTDSTMTKCAKYWVYWNLMSEKRAEWTYRIENFDNEYKEMARRLNRKFDAKILSTISKKTNAKNNTRLLSWKILKDELDPDLMNQVRELAIRYGYVVPAEAY